MQVPIIDVIFDIWFESNMPSEVLLGIIIEENLTYNKVKNLPLLQVPLDIRLMDSNLKHQPLYEILSEEKPYKIILGHNSLGLALNGEYQGWDESFFPEIKNIYKTIFEKKIINKITRCGLRYIDFFENENIYEIGKISIKINDNTDTKDKLFLRVEKDVDSNIAMAVVINNKASVKNFNGDKVGSIIDIASFIKNKDFLNKNNFFDITEQLHKINKNYFKEVANDKLIEQLGI